MTRILFVTDSLIAGGIESQLVELITRLDRSRFEPHVLIFYRPPTHSPHFLPMLEAAGVAVTTLDLGWGARDKGAAALGVIRAAWRLRPDIIQAENYHANLLTRTARPFLPPGVRLIGTHRGVYTAHQLRYEQVGWWLCDAIVASAGHLKRQLVEGAGADAGRVVVIPNSVDVARFAGATEAGAELRARLTPGARRVMVSVGRISHEKRMELIPQALGELRRSGVSLDGVRVVIVGHAQEAEYQRRLDEAIAREGLAEVMIQRPVTDAPEVYFAAADVSLLASPSEGLPIVALESLAAGKPVILSTGANAAEVVRDGETGWVTPTNAPKALALGLRQALEAPDETLRTMGAACQRAAEEYTAPRLARRYMRLYEALLAAPRLTPRTERAKALAEATR